MRRLLTIAAFAIGFTQSIAQCPAVFTVNGGGARCSNAPGLPVNLSGSEAGVTYQLTINDTNEGAALEGTGSALTWTVTEAGTYTVTATRTSTGTSEQMGGSAAIVVNAIPAIPVITTPDATILTCHVTPIRLYGNSSTPGAVFRWTGPGGLDATTKDIKVTVPGNYILTATNPLNGCERSRTQLVSQSLTKNFTVVADPVNAISCETPSVMLSGTVIGIFNNPNYRWTGPSCFASSEQRPVVTEPGDYTLTVTTEGGCTGDATATVSVTIDTTVPEGVTASVSGALNDCGSDYVILSASSNTPAVSYQWTGPEGFEGVEQETVTGTPGDYKVVAIHPSSGCRSTPAVVTVPFESCNGGTGTASAGNVVATSSPTTQSAVVAPQSNAATAQFSAALFTVDGGGEVCSSLTSTLVTLSDSEVGVNYQLKSGANDFGPIVAGTGTLLSWSCPPGTYTVIASSPVAGCSETMVMTGSATVTLKALPASFTVEGGGTYCSGSGSLITLGGSQTGMSYQLKRDGADIGSPVSGTGSALTWPAQGSTGTYTVQAMNPTSGCSVIMNGSAVVVIKPTPGLYAVGGGGSSCTGPDAAITLCGSEPGVSYQLKVGEANAGAPANGTGATLSWAPTAAGVFTVVATNATTGCGQAMTGNATATGFSPSSLDFQAEEVNGTHVFTPAFAGAGCTAVYTWNFGDGFTSVEQNTRHLYTATGTYTVTLTVNYTCGSCSGELTATHAVTIENGLCGAIYCDGDGGVGIGTRITDGFRLSVNGKIRASDIIKVYPQNQWSDFVFDKDYKLRPLSEVEAFIKKNGHLPEIPSAKEVESQGIDLGGMEAKLLQKIEELTLYMIELKKENDALKKKVDTLSKAKN